ncbi:MAG: glycosyltransferase [Phycisphaeraceae bacterium]
MIQRATGGLKLVFLGLSITSSWGNGHASIYRGLVRALAGRGHDVLFLERDMPWYASNRDLPRPPAGRTELYASVGELKRRFAGDVMDADAVIVGSYVPDGIEVGRWVTRTARGVTAFYDIDTPVTLARMEAGGLDYIAPELIPAYGMYLSFTGGPVLERLEQVHGSPMARPFYCCVDPDAYPPLPGEPIQWDLGYMGTCSSDRMVKLESLVLTAAQRWPQGRFVVAGPQYPTDYDWPVNVERIDHLPPPAHPRFYAGQRFTLNLTRADMVAAGYSPSVRLFEAAACAVPVISDAWAGLESFFAPGREILITRSADETLEHLRQIPEDERRAIGQRARARVLAEHTTTHRAIELERYIAEARGTHTRTAETAHDAAGAPDCRS